MQRKPKTAVIFDLDGTITRRDTYAAFLLGFLRRYPHRALRSVWLPLAALLYMLRFRDNAWLKQTFLQSIAGGATELEVSSYTKEFVARLIRTGIRPGALRAIRDHREKGHHLILVTASFDFYVRELADQLGIESLICTRSMWDGTGKLKGKINGHNCYGPEKLKQLISHFGNQRDQWYLIGYSDHHSDSGLLNWVDRAVAVNPTRKLKAAILAKGYPTEDWDRPPAERVFRSVIN